MLGTENIDIIAIELYQERRMDIEWKQQIRHGHVYDKIVDCSSQCFRPVDNNCDEEIPDQRNDKNQAQSKGYSDFSGLRVA